MEHFTIGDITPISCDGLVFYCDGSAKPNPGYIGAGLHGYAFNKEIPKKGVGLTSHSITAIGYIDNKEVAKDKSLAVTPLQFYNVVGSFGFQTTNNVAELLAVHVAIKIALATKAKSILVKTDSDYVVKILTKFAAIWVKNNWVKKDGNPVTNQDFIKALLKSIAELQEKEIKFDIQWIKGHSTYLGNNIADKLANIGGEFSRLRRVEINIQEHPSAGYWKSVNDRHPFICLRSAYFGSELTVPKNMYYLGNHGKDDDFIGRPEVDAALSVIQLTEPNQVLDTIIEHSRKNAECDTKFFYAKLDNVFTKNRDKDISLFGEGTLIIDNSNKRNDVISGDETFIVRDINPFRLSERTFASLAELQDRLVKHVEGADYPTTVVNDITDIFYDTTKKIVKNVETTEIKLKNEYIVGYRSKKLKVKHLKGDLNVILTLGIDIPDRNALKRLEEYYPTVKILTWLESEKCVRSATIIQTKRGDYGIWCGYHSNKHYIE